MNDDHAKCVADTAVAQIGAGAAPWFKDQPAGVSYLPYNPVSRRPFEGPNALWLAMQGREDSRWLTGPQAEAQGAQIRAGERGAAVQFWQLETQAPALDADGQPQRDASGAVRLHTVSLSSPRLMTAIVFNAEQMTGLEPSAAPPRPDAAERRRLAQSLLERSPTSIAHAAVERGVYQPRSDAILLPEPGGYDTLDRYYAAALRELAHSAARHTRQDAGVADPLGSIAASLEEVRADLAAYVLGDALGLGYAPQATEQAFRHWAEALSNDPTEFFRAGCDAELAAEFVLDLERQVARARELDLAAPSTAKVFHPADSLAPEIDMAIEAAEAATSAPLVDEAQKARAKAARDTQLALDQPLDHTPEYGPEQDLADVQPDVEPALADEIENISDSLAYSMDFETANGGPQIEENILAAQRIDLSVPYAQRDEAKGLGARWDQTEKTWYAPAGADQEPLKRWIPAEHDIPRAISQDPVQAFHSVLNEAGFQLGGRPPQLDGQLHEVPVTGDKPGERSGAYRAFDDRDKGGHPAGWLQNHREGTKETWVFSQRGRALNAVERAQAYASSAQRRNEIAEAQATHAKIASQAIAARLAQSPDATAQHPYLKAKGVPAHGLSLAEGEALAMPSGDANPQLWGADGDLLVPARDITGEIRSAQAIGPNGRKTFAKGASFAGAFHMIGVPQSPETPLLIAEGYATAAELHRATGFPVAVAFTANNLEPVAHALRSTNPDRPIGIAGDNDHLRAQDIDPATGAPKKNVGGIAAQKAAQAVDGFTLIPEFDPVDRGADWNDLRALKGAAEMRAQLARGLAIASQDRLARDASRGLDIGPAPPNGLLSPQERDLLQNPTPAPIVAPVRAQALAVAREPTPTRDISDLDRGR